MSECKVMKGMVNYEKNYDLNRQKVKCVHPAANLVAIADLSDDTKTVGTSTCFFKYRSVTQCRCNKCGSLIKTYGAWKYFKKHSFPFLGETCKLCGYKK